MKYSKQKKHPLLPACLFHGWVMLGKATRDRSYLYHNYGLLSNITSKENFKIGKNDCQKAECQIFQRKQACTNLFSE